MGAIDALGEQVDRDLARQDVRLTQGGEPTFVSIDDMEGPEWNYTAHVADRSASWPSSCCTGLRARFAPGRLRSTSARASGIPASRCRAGRSASSGAPTASRCGSTTHLIADTTRPGTVHARRTAQAFGERLAAALGLPPSLLITAYEDVPQACSRRKPRCRSTSIRCSADLAEPDERARLARLLERALGAPAGFVLPLRAVGGAGGAATGWLSSPWPLRRGQLFAVGGDSPLGFRLPLASLPECCREEEEPEFALDPFAPRDELPHARRPPQPGTGRRARRTSRAK